MSEKLGILVLAADTVLRDGLCALLRGESELDLIGTLDDTRAIAGSQLGLTPDVVILDIDVAGNSPESGFTSTIARIHHRWPHTRVVALTFRQDDTVLERTLRAGAAVYLKRSYTGKDLTNTLHEIRQARRSGPICIPLPASCPSPASHEPS